MCGGTARPLYSARGMSGLSPRVRGNPLEYQLGVGTERSIPACAGEPAPAARWPCPTWVYPRVCGGTLAAAARATGDIGLSPRVRGNPRFRFRTHALGGSIPACAGEPGVGADDRSVRWVYPRVCGGTVTDLAPRPVRRGLSPRVRGNPDHLPQANPRPGSIPACAGEPTFQNASGGEETVYPRVCGGTVVRVVSAPVSTGLSPRVRGNQTKCSIVVWSGRSIPACAGEPGRARPGTAPARVYPRVCGGTSVRGGNRELQKGLSPRVRGNPLAARATDDTLGSIPACAGEPTSRDLLCAAIWVYPRVCGGTAPRRTGDTQRQGLSPRVRGNLGMVALAASTARSIPACAGEPPSLGHRPRIPRVYPRVCGGTQRPRSRRLFVDGLSPRVRGNPWQIDSFYPQLFAEGR